MAYTADNLVMIAHGGPVVGQTPPGNTQRLFMYNTNDAAAAIETNAYFDGALENGLRVGDIIIAACDLDGTPALNLYLVSVGGADVTVVPHDVI